MGGVAELILALKNADEKENSIFSFKNLLIRVQKA